MKERTIYSRRMAYQLRKLGFRIIRLDVNPHRPQFDSWVFEETPELLAALTKLSRR